MKTFDNWIWKKIGRIITAATIEDMAGKNLFGKPKMDENVAQQIETLEDKAFPHGGAQPADDILDDAVQPGAVFPVAKTDTGEIAGYITGYDYIEDDNAEDIAEYLNEVKMYTAESPQELYQDLKKYEKKGKVHYTANFHVSDEIAGKEKNTIVFKLLMQYLDTLRKKGYKYVAVHAMPDTWNLLFRGGEMRQERMKRFGVELVASLPANLVGGYVPWHDNSFLALFRIL